MHRIDAIFFFFFFRQLFKKNYLFIYFVRDMFIILFSTQSGINFAKHLSLQASGNIFWILYYQIDSIFLFFIYLIFFERHACYFLIRLFNMQSGISFVKSLSPQASGNNFYISYIFVIIMVCDFNW